MAKPLRHTHPQPPLYLGGMVPPEAVSPDVVTQHQQTLSIDYDQLTGTNPSYTKAEADAITDALATQEETDVAALEAVDITKAPLASPALTGVPTAPTAAPATNSTQIATTAFVLANGAAWPPLQPTSLSNDLTIPAGDLLPVFGDFDINATLDVAGTFNAYS